MDTIHIFFDSFEEWRKTLLAGEGFYGLPFSRTERMNVDGVYRITSLIQLSQVHDQGVHHLVLNICSRIEPTQQDERDRDRQKTDAAWNAVKAWAEREQYGLIEGMVSSPADLHTLSIYLPECFQGAEAQS
jgi:hypothetical protein